MLIDVVEVKYIKDYKLFLKFENSKEGVIDLSDIIPFEGIFAELKDPNYFATVKINKDLGTIVWDNGADLAPHFLYEAMTTQAA